MTCSTTIRKQGISLFPALSSSESSFLESLRLVEFVKPLIALIRKQFTGLVNGELALFEQAEIVFLASTHLHLDDLLGLAIHHLLNLQGVAFLTAIVPMLLFGSLHRHFPYIHHDYFIAQNLPQFAFTRQSKRPRLQQNLLYLAYRPTCGDLIYPQSKPKRNRVG